MPCQFRCSAPFTFGLSVLLLSCLVSLVAGGGHVSKNTATVSSETWDSFLAEKRQKRRRVLVMFHVSWCKACQKTFPIFNNASDLVHEENIPLDFAHVDCTDDKALCQRFTVQGYPTLKLFHPEDDKQPQLYKGQRTERGFLKYAKRMTSSPSQPFQHFDEFEKALLDEPYSGFIVTRDTPGLDPIAERWMDRHMFAAVDSIGKFVSQTIPTNAALAVYSLPSRQWGGSSNASAKTVVDVFDGSIANPFEVEEWISSNRFPGIWQLNEANFYEFTHSDMPVVIIILGETVTDELEKEIRGAQDAYRGTYFFGVLNGTDWAEELKMFNIHHQELPRILIGENNFETWIEDINELRADNLKGDLKRYVDGAPLLRQGRSVSARMMFYKRQIWRFILQAKQHAETGPLEATIVGTAATLSMAVFIAIGWLLSSCCRLLFEDEEIASEVRQKKTK